mgnify:FL=1
MSDVAISVDNVTKLYKLYDKPSDRLKEALGLTKQKKYREHYALQNLSFEVKKGECVGIIGTNGAGKSTILKIITGVLNPTHGNVTINGRISALLELGAGFNMEYTGIENVYLNGTMIGFSREEIDAKMDDILAFADIGDFVNQPVKTYSSGMFVRLAFAVAINIDPEILIVDEALSVGDVFFQAKCYQRFEDFKKMGKTILFVSHDMGSINKYCDRAILLNKGTKYMDGEPKEVIDVYKKLIVNAGNDEDNTKSGKSAAQKPDDGLWMDKLHKNESVQEYGNGYAHIIDYAIIDEYGMITNTISANTEYTIKIRVKFAQKVHMPIVAFTIRDLKGVEIAGTNTMYEDKNISDKAENDEVIVTFKQKMKLRGGEYLMSLGCTGYQDGEFIVFHRLYDVCDLTVINEKNIVGLFDIESQVSLEE